MLENVERKFQKYYHKGKGRKEMLPAEIYKIKDKILDTVKVTKIYLFGSYARGTQTSQSDYDFFVIVPNDSIRPLKIAQMIYCALAKEKLSTPIDILASYEKDFEKRKNIQSTIEQTIRNEGVLLYEQ